MEKYKLLRLFILCNCITLSLQIFVMEKDEDKPAWKILEPWTQLKLNSKGRKVYHLEGIRKKDNITVQGNLTLTLCPIKFELTDKKITLQSTNSKNTLKKFVEVTKKNKKVKIRKLLTNTSSDNIKIVLTLEIPTFSTNTWNKEITLRNASLKGCLCVEDDVGPNIEATNSVIKIKGKSTNNLVLILNQSTFNHPSNTTFDTDPTVFLVENGLITLDLYDSHAHLFIGKKVVVNSKLSHGSSLVLYGKIKQKNIVYANDGTSKIIIKNRKKERTLEGVTPHKKVKKKK